MHKTLKTKNKEVPRPFLLCFLLFFSFKLMVLGGGGGGGEWMSSINQFHFIELKFCW